jgi:hypothetical protein
VKINPLRPLVSLTAAITAFYFAGWRGVGCYVFGTLTSTALIVWAEWEAK